MRIPPVLHQSWKTARIRNSQWRKFQKKLRRLHPTWEYRFWTDDDNRRLVIDNYPEYLPIYDSLPSPVDRADMARYLYMHAIGGFYVDMDYEVLKPLDPGDWELILPYARQVGYYDDTFDMLDPCIMASRRGHPLWLRIVESLPDRVREAERSGRSRNSIFTTGPGALTAEGFKESHRVYFPPRYVYHPYFHPRNKDEYRSIIAADRSVGIHHCSGTWMDKENPLRRKLRLALRPVRRILRGQPPPVVTSVPKEQKEGMLTP